MIDWLAEYNRVSDAFDIIESFDADPTPTVAARLKRACLYSARFKAPHCEPIAIVHWHGRTGLVRWSEPVAVGDGSFRQGSVQETTIGQPIPCRQSVVGVATCGRCGACVDRMTARQLLRATGRKVWDEKGEIRLRESVIFALPADWRIRSNDDSNAAKNGNRPFLGSATYLERMATEAAFRWCSDRVYDAIVSGLSVDWHVNRTDLAHIYRRDT